MGGQVEEPADMAVSGFVPSDAELVVIAGEVNFTTLARDFQIGLVKARNVPSMRELAAQEGGTADEIAGRLAVLSPRDVYFTSFRARNSWRSIPPIANTPLAI